jgi:hypothetical protein
MQDADVKEHALLPEPDTGSHVVTPNTAGFTVLVTGLNLPPIHCSRCSGRLNSESQEL